MIGSLLTSLLAGILSKIIVPLISKVAFLIAEYYQMKADETQRNKEIQDLIDRNKAAVTREEKENAFKDLIKYRPSV